jgi:hypothetical protein
MEIGFDITLCNFPRWHQLAGAKELKLFDTTIPISWHLGN